MKSGISILQGPHQVAQKLINTTFPFKSYKETFSFSIKSSFEEIKNTNSVAEPVIYSFSNYLIGGFYRAHENKANNENLNSPGMIFHPIPLNDICISPDMSTPVDSQINRYYVYGVIARLAILSAAKELFNLE